MLLLHFFFTEYTTKLVPFKIIIKFKLLLMLNIFHKQVLFSQIYLQILNHCFVALSFCIWDSNWSSAMMLGSDYHVQTQMKVYLNENYWGAVPIVMCAFCVCIATMEIAHSRIYFDVSIFSFPTILFTKCILNFKFIINPLCKKFFMQNKFYYKHF